MAAVSLFAGETDASPGKSGRTISRRTMRNTLQIQLLQTQGSTTENRGVPGSSPGLAIISAEMPSRAAV